MREEWSSSQGAKGKIDVGNASQLFVSKRHFEAAAGDFGLTEGAPIDKDVAPPAVTLQITFNLKVDMVANFAVHTAPAHAKVELVFVKTGVEPAPVALQL